MSLARVESDFELLDYPFVGFYAGKLQWHWTTIFGLMYSIVLTFSVLGFSSR